MSKKHKNFLDLPRHVRGDMRQKIKNDINEYGFASYLECGPDSNLATGESGWFDYYFLSPIDNRIFYNATIITKDLRAYDMANDIAYKEVRNLLTPEEYAEALKLEWEPEEVSSTGKVLSYQMVFPEQTNHDSLGGLTYDEYVEKRVAELIPTIQFDPKDTYTIETDYAYGIGLIIVADKVDITTMQYHMKKFLENEPRFDKPNSKT